MKKNSAAEAAARSLRTVLGDLLRVDLAVFTNSVQVDAGVVTWAPWPGAAPVLRHRGETRISDYLHWVRNGHYSAILLDGALLQLSMEFVGNTLATQRLVYVPCPVTVPEELLRLEAVDEAIELYLSDQESTVMQTDVRFDYDLEAAAADHAASHLTLNRPSCRIPCLAPLLIADFIDLVFRHLYPKAWTDHAFLRSVPGERLAATIEVHQRDQLHVAWR